MTIENVYKVTIMLLIIIASLVWLWFGPYAVGWLAVGMAIGVVTAGSLYKW